MGWEEERAGEEKRSFDQATSLSSCGPSSRFFAARATHRHSSVTPIKSRPRLRAEIIKIFIACAIACEWLYESCIPHVLLATSASF